MDTQNNAILYSKKPLRPPLSCQHYKNSHTLLALERTDLSDTITFSEEAVNSINWWDSSNMELEPGDQLTVEQTLYGVMLQSANEAAYGLAEYVSGSVDAFAQDMTDYAISLGCRMTHFTNASGLHDDNHYTTAKDLALYVLRTITARGALGCVVEYQGSGVEALSVEERMTLCNLTVEAGARGAIIAPTKERASGCVRTGSTLIRMSLKRLRATGRRLLPTPQEVVSFKTVVINAGDVKPMVTWGTSPDQCVAFDEPVPAADSFRGSRTACGGRPRPGVSGH